MLRFALTIFLSAFLLFQVQPLMGKYILPWFGGTSGVWTTCMLFFQMVLLAGYAYAHFLGRFPWKKQATIHLVMLALALIFMPIEPNADWRPVDGSTPTLRILLLLAATLGLPYLVISSTGPLLQNWFSATYPGRSPYRLYSLSNVGSLLALISFPIWVETNLSRQHQVWSWSIGFGLFVLCCGWCAWKMTNIKVVASSVHVPSPAVESDAEREALIEPLVATQDIHSMSWKRFWLLETLKNIPVLRLGILLVEKMPFTPLLWVLLSASGSAMLLATTNQLTAEVAVVPFLWIIPLSLYLVTFIICFDNERWYSRVVFGSMVLLTVPIAIVLLHQGVSAKLWLQVAGYSGCMFACCMTCHGELVRSRPDPKYLTLFYLLISAGGALGGLFVAVVAPLTLNGYYEYHAALFACVAMTCVAWARSGLLMRAPYTVSVWPYVAGAVVAVVAGLFALVAMKESLSDWPWNDPVVVLTDIWTQIRELDKKVLGAVSGVLGLIMLASLGDRLRASWGSRPAFGFAALGVAVVGLAVALLMHIGESHEGSIHTVRNFYGVLHVERDDSTEITTRNADGEDITEDLGPQHKLVHGRIMHGHQYIKDSPQRRWHTSYYGRDSGVGIAIEDHPRRSDPDPANRTMHIGCIGLGTGTLSTYGKAGDKVRIYEINPAVEAIARKWFFYLTDAEKVAKVDVVLGDARVMLERELERNEVQKFDVLAVDAFSSDSIPVHLLTKECAAMYFKHIKPDGVLALHISNRFIDLEPVTYALAKEFKKQVVLISNSSDSSQGVSSSSWVLLTDNKEFFAKANESKDAEPWVFFEKVPAEYLETIRGLKKKYADLEVGDPNPVYPKPILWTDDFASLWNLLDF